MLSRLETMVLMAMDLPVSAVRRQIAAGIDVMVHLGRMRDKTRKVLEIVEVTGYRHETEEILTQTLFAFEEGEDSGDKVKGSLIRKGDLQQRMKLERAGYDGRMI